MGQETMAGQRGELVSHGAGWEAALVTYSLVG